MTEPVLYSALRPVERRAKREEYVRDQNGLCHFCVAPLSGQPPSHVLELEIDWSKFPRGRGFLDYPVHLHHDHTTGLTIGAVHAYCNAVLFQYHGE